MTSTDQDDPVWVEEEHSYVSVHREVRPMIRENCYELVRPLWTRKIYKTSIQAMTRSIDDRLEEPDDPRIADILANARPYYLYTYVWHDPWCHRLFIEALVQGRKLRELCGCGSDDCAGRWLYKWDPPEALRRWYRQEPEYSEDLGVSAAVVERYDGEEINGSVQTERTITFHNPTRFGRHWSQTDFSVSSVESPVSPRVQLQQQQQQQHMHLQQRLGAAGESRGQLDELPEIDLGEQAPLEPNDGDKEYAEEAWMQELYLRRRLRVDEEHSHQPIQPTHNRPSQVVDGGREVEGVPVLLRTEETERHHGTLHDFWRLSFAFDSRDLPPDMGTIDVRTIDPQPEVWRGSHDTAYRWGGSGTNREVRNEIRVLEELEELKELDEKLWLEDPYLQHAPPRADLHPYSFQRRK